MQTLRIGNLILEPLVEAHAEEMFALLSDPELYRFLDYPPPPSVQHLRNVYTRLERRSSLDGKELWLNWVIREPVHGLIGYVQATVHRDGSAFIAYVLGRASWGRGYATAATSAMLQHLATEYDARCFLATVERSNAKSIGVLGRLGFAEADAGESARHGLSSTERLFVARPDKAVTFEKVPAR